MHKKKKAKKENSERWLLTYSDLITLLMILFILLFAMSNVNQDKYDKLSASLSNSLGAGSGILEGSGGVLEGGDGILPTDDGLPSDVEEIGEEQQVTATPVPTVKPADNQEPSDNQGTEPQNTGLSGYLSTEKDMENLQAYFNDVIKELHMGDHVATDVRADGLVATFSNDVFFDSGDDTLKADMISGLKKLAPLLNEIDNTIIVEGHTDNVAMSKNSKFSSNWQLSATRAANVVQYLVEQCGVEGARISAVGYGEYHPKVSNGTAAGRSRNRRIDIIILYDDGSPVAEGAE